MKLPRWVPTWFYANMPVKKDEEVGKVELPLFEWCHLCQRSHPYPAEEYCQSRGR
jgi:hypothetical protein